MNYIINVADAATEDIRGDVYKIASLEVYNEGPGDLYYGDVPEAPVVALNVSYPNGAAYIDVPDLSGRLMDGMLVTSSVGGSMPAGMAITRVTEIPGGLISPAKRVYLSAVTTALGAGATVTFTPPPITALTGIPILPGGKETFTGANGNWLSQQGLRLFGGAGGNVLRVRKKYF